MTNESVTYIELGLAVLNTEAEADVSPGGAPR